MKPAPASLWKSYLGNLGRPAQDGECEEFERYFAAADQAVLRRAMDKLFAVRREFVRLADLRSHFAAELDADEKLRRTRGSGPACLVCDGKGMLPEVSRRDGEPILRYGIACPSCEAGAAAAVSAKLPRPGFEALPHVAEAQAATDGGAGWYANWVHADYARAMDAWRGVRERPLPGPLAESLRKAAMTFGIELEEES